MPNKFVKGLKVNGRDGVTERHNSKWEERKSNQLGDANFIEHQLRRVFYDTFSANKTAELASLGWGAPGRVVLCTVKRPRPNNLAKQHWTQSLMGWHLLSACSRPHWGNEAVSVCCSGWLCVPFITVKSQKHTKKRSGVPLLSNLSCFGLYDHRPPRGESLTLDPYISISAFWASTAFVSAHSSCQDVCLHC